jgi:hypothetical protein
MEPKQKPVTTTTSMFDDKAEPNESEGWEQGS